MVTVALASARDLPPMDQDESALAAALADRDVAAVVVPWDEPHDWSQYPVVVIRSTWDYTERRDDFIAWADDVESVTRLCNSAQVVRWNSHKGYLIELEERGAPIVPTAWLGRGDRISLPDLLAARGWKDAVVKPAVGAGAIGLFRVDGETAELGQHHLDAILARGDAMVQPYLPTIEEHGETSVVLIDGAYSHTVIKRPAPGDHRIQIEHGGTYERVEPDPEVVDLATWIVESTGHELLYARVDLIPDGSGTPQLVELEAIEPSLFLDWAPDGAGRLADAVVRRL